MAESESSEGTVTTPISVSTVTVVRMGYGMRLPFIFEIRVKIKLPVWLIVFFSKFSTDRQQALVQIGRKRIFNQIFISVQKLLLVPGTNDSFVLIRESHVKHRVVS